MVNNVLKAKIIERFGTQIEFAQAIGASPPHVSMVVRDWQKLSAGDQKRWAEALGCKVSDIF